MTKIKDGIAYLIALILPERVCYYVYIRAQKTILERIRHHGT